MKNNFHSLAVAVVAMAAAGAASADNNVFKLGISEYTTHSKTNGVSGIGVPAGADAETGNATTVIFTYERMVTPNIGAELVLGIPPRVKAKATGSVAFLGEVLTAKNFSPTFLVNYHFGAPGDTWRPYLGAGFNYTRYLGVKSSLAPDVKLGDSSGWALNAGVEYAIAKNCSLFASVAAFKAKTKLVATGATVLQSTIDLRPVVYSFGAAYRF
jgi:outer membrane protein